MSEIQIEAVVREKLGGNHSKHFRNEGKIPCVIYGGHQDTIPIIISYNELIKLYRGSKYGKNTVLRINIVKDKKTESVDVISCQYEYDPITNRMNHVDFLRVTPKTKLALEIPIILEGVAPGVKMGGLLVKGKDMVKIQCSPDKIPVSFTINISNMNIGDSFRVKDLAKDSNYIFLSPEDLVLVKVQGARVEKEEVAAPAATTVAPTNQATSTTAAPAQEKTKA